MNIAILTIATGRYISLFNELEKSIFDKFLTKHNKTIFLFTDQDNLKLLDRVKIKKITHLPWPLNTLLRFNYFNTVIDELKNYDIIYYLDSDIVVYNTVDEEIIPINNEIIATKQYWFENTIGTYEISNKNSTAYVEKSTLTAGQYCQACFFGAKTSEFITMNSVLNKNIIEDFKNNTIAVWHDESHFNKYILNVPCRRLHTGYCHPNHEDINSNINPIKLLHKNSHSTGI